MSVTSKMNIDPTIRAPLADQITAEIRRLVEAGELKAGDPIPAPEVMAREILVGPASARRAFEKLLEAGVIRATRRGYEVAERSPQEPASDDS